MSRYLRVVVCFAVLVLVASCAREEPVVPKANGVAATGDPAKDSDSSPTDSAPRDAVKSESNAESAQATSAPGDADKLAAPVATSGETPKPEDVLRQMGEFYKQLNSFAVQIENTNSIKSDGEEHRDTRSSSFAVERPNKVALRADQAYELIANSENTFISIPEANRYSKADPLVKVADAMTLPLFQTVGFGDGGPVLLQLIADDPTAQLLEGVESSAYVGREELKGMAVHHLRFGQPQFDWEVWIAADKDPVLYQFSMDWGKSFAQQAQAGGPQFSMVTLVEFRDWQFNQQLPAETFAFTPPEGTEEVADLFEMGEMEEEPSDLLGQAAPPIELPRLDGEKFQLAAHANKDVVMLDFWATWCGPCVEELPLLVEVAEEYKDKGVAFVGINLGEDSETIRQFLEEKKLSFDVALDEDNAIGRVYGAQAIPMLVLVDKAGVVQSVHIGYNPQIKTKLREELDAILAGKNLAEDALRKREEREKEEMHAAPDAGLVEVWSHAGEYQGVAANANTGTIFAALPKGECDLFHFDGEQQGSISLFRPAELLRTARLIKDGPGELVGFEGWGNSVIAYSHEGEVLWRETGGDGINDVWPADLDGDGLDEVIVGYNGSTGLHVFEHDGARRWSTTDIGNVWHVSAGDVDGDGKPDVICTSAAGMVHIFQADGTKVGDVSPGIYANMVRVGKLNQDDPAWMFTGGSGEGDDVLVAIDQVGTQQWQHAFPPRTDHVDSAEICPGRPWIAIGIRGGAVEVVDTESGERVALQRGHGRTPQVTWAVAANQEPLLLVAGGELLKAYHVQPEEKANPNAPTQSTSSEREPLEAPRPELEVTPGKIEQ